MRINLKDIDPSITEWTPQGGTDCTPVLEAACTALGGRGIVEIPEGKWRFNTPPNPAIISGQTIEGFGRMNTHMMYCGTAQVFLRYTAEDDYTGGGVRRVNVRLGTGYGASSCYGIYAKGTLLSQPDLFRVEEVDVSVQDAVNDTWHTPVFYDGIDSPSGGSAPQGIRHASLSSVRVFRGRVNGFYFRNCVALYASDISTSSGVGTGNNIVITGGNSTTTNTNGMTISGMHCNGSLVISNASRVWVDGYCSQVVFGAGANRIAGRIFAPSGLSNTSGSPLPANCAELKVIQ